MNRPPQSPVCKFNILTLKLCGELLPQKRTEIIKTKQDLIDNVMDIWIALSQVYILSLYNSLPKRTKAVIVADGSKKF